MKRLFYLISALLFCLGIVFYKQTPTYNPFDDVFDIDTNQLVECDTIGGMCGFFNFQPKTDKRLKMSYQIFGNNIVAKCFTYAEDTIPIPEKYEHDSYIDSIMKLLIDIEEFNNSLKEFDYVYLDKITEKNVDTYYPKIRIIHKNYIDTTSLYWEVSEEDSTKLIRAIRYFKSKPRIFRNANGGFID
ncbi:hypothetical protein WAF17_13835 [Bernardetia sp. ABR2-2B]|uniref:hypothetical protein n=1 Tax=Bernardetia sp. ABR2-2B TaxID=3127472 RepID=UPI0030CDF7A6